MAITVSLPCSISTDRETFTVTDSSTFASPVRADCQVYLSAAKLDVNNVATSLTVTSDDTDPNTDSSWVVEYTIDGTYRMYYVVIEEEYDAGDTYAQYAAVYSGAVVYRSKQAGNIGHAVSDTDWWEVISSPASLAANKDTATESENITSLVYLRVFAADSQYTFANTLADQCGCSDCGEDSTLQEYNVFAMWIDGLAIADSRSEIVEGETIARRISSKFIDC